MQPNKSMLLAESVHNLIGSETTDILEGRIQILLDKYIANTSSFKIQNLEEVGDLFHFLSNKVQEDNVYWPYLREFLKIARHLPDTGDEIFGCHVDNGCLRGKFKHYVLNIAQLVTKIHSEELHLLFVTDFLSLFTQKYENAVLNKYLMEALEERAVLNELCKSLTVLYPCVYVLSLKLFLTMVVASQVAQSFIINEGYISVVLKRMTPWFAYKKTLLDNSHSQLKMEYRELVQSSVEFLENLLQCAPFKLDAGLVVSTAAVKDLMDMVKDATDFADHVVFTKSMRNRLFSIFVKMQQLFFDKGVQTAVNQLRLVEEIIYFDTRCKVSLHRRDIDEEDKEFAKLLALSRYCILLFNSETLTSQSRNLLAKNCLPNYWFPDSEYLKYCFVLGRQFILHLKYEFLQTRGCEKLLHIMRLLVKERNVNEVLFEVLNTVEQLVYLPDNEKLLECLRSNDIMKLMLSASKKLLLRENTKSVEKIALTHTLNAINKLVQDQTAVQDRHYEDYVQIFSATLDYVQIRDTYNMTDSEQLYCTVLALISSAIAPNATSTEKFATQGWIHKLLNHLTVSIENVTSQVLRVLIGLTQGQAAVRCIQCILMWREPCTCRSFLQEACHMWRQIEKQERVLRTAQGLIADCRHPVLGQQHCGDRSFIAKEPCQRALIHTLVDLVLKKVDTISHEYQNLGGKDVSIINNNLNVKDSNVTVRNNNLDVKDSHVSVRNNNLNVKDSHVSVRNTNLNVKDSNVTARYNNLNVKDSHVSVRNNNLNVKDDNLSVNDRITMVLIRNFPVLMQHALWRDLQRTHASKENRPLKKRTRNNRDQNLKSRGCHHHVDDTLKEAARMSQLAVEKVLREQQQILEDENLVRAKSLEHVYKNELKKQTWGRYMSSSDLEWYKYLTQN